VVAPPASWSLLPATFQPLHRGGFLAGRQRSPCTLAASRRLGGGRGSKATACLCGSSRFGEQRGLLSQWGADAHRLSRQNGSPVAGEQWPTPPDIPGPYPLGEQRSLLPRWA